MRHHLWNISKQTVNEQNNLYAENKTTYRMTGNVFSILTDLEIKKIYKGLSMPTSSSYDRFSRRPGDEYHNSDVGITKNWTDLGYVTKVQNQGPYGCGSCWAFSATGAIEAAYKRRYNTTEVLDLSESNLINCVDDEYTCLHGSNPLYAFQHVSKYGIATEKDIPYKPVKGQCNNTKNLK
jgi:hypothetical protein